VTEGDYFSKQKEKRHRGKFFTKPVGEGEREKTRTKESNSERLGKGNWCIESNAALVKGGRFRKRGESIDTEKLSGKESSTRKTGDDEV